MIKVFYTPKQSCKGNDSYSPSAGKPEQVIADWMSRPELAMHIDVTDFQPATLLDLYSAHRTSHVDAVLSGREMNGFGNTSMDVAATLPYTVGSMLNAARYAIDHKTVAFSPTSGFHHAGFEYCSGFCTFNGLMVTAIRMLQRHPKRRILILDYDQHYGDGTEDIIVHESLHEQVRHITSGKSYTTGAQGLHVLKTELANVKDFDLVLFQAGADIHVDDPLGGKMTTEQMRQRDEMVFTACKEAGVPLVWNLAGGYQRDAAGTIEPVLALHRQTMIECIKQYGGDQ